MSVFGIDLGTTYSCVATCDSRGHVDMLTFEKERTPTIPSVVGFLDDGTPYVGQKAKNGLMINAEKAIDTVKREMNSEYCEKELMINGIQRKLSPIEPSSCILRYLYYHANKTLIETYNEKETNKVVVTVPAAFNDAQREKTKLAAELAGMEVLGLLQEPTAAAIAYNIKPEETILVFDLGGGTLDVSIVKYEKSKSNSYNVLGTPAGDVHLGGKDWDEALVLHALRKANVDPETIDRHGRYWALLMHEAENRKIELTDNIETQFSITLPEVTQIVPIRRSEFETITASLVRRAVKVVEKAISNANNAVIDRFVLVGGSSRMPMIIKTLEKEFLSKISNHRLLKDWISLEDPDYAIAKGAAKYAAIVNNKDKNDIEVNDKTTRSYGFKALRQSKEIVMNIIYADDNCVVDNRSFTLTTRRDNQEKIDIVIVENDSIEDETVFDCANPLIIKSLKLPPNTPQGTDVDFIVSRDKNGIVHVEVGCGSNSISFQTKEIAEDYIIKQVKETIQKMINKEN
ncbi:MAG: Hsp70 family protein [Bacteroidales bacterium]|nr:Hsp70 family protein [Bacteroidales bacterium]